jgi:glycosyltransferase involved in cell wall biosynthesis
VRLINPNDPAALADALEAVLSDPSLAATMAAEARRLFEIRFHLDHWVKAVHSWLHAQSLSPAPSRP